MKKSNSTKGEVLVQTIFKEKYNLDFEKILTDISKTADFFIKKDNNTIGVVEVKDFENVFPTEKNTFGYIKDYLGFWIKKENSANRVSKKITESHKQLSRYSEPKILILVNYSLDLDVLDLKGTIDGYLIYSSKDGNMIKNLAPYNKTYKKIKTKISDFSAIFWVETNNTKISRFNNENLFCLYNDKKFIEKLLQK
ncbi:MAG: hypothetical protein NTZ87_02180 [Candidatus Nomurabacteria bacterium]|nr:hypothetical protein [Candidatus Nomurabacteria bacterium]